MLPNRGPLRLVFVAGVVNPYCDRFSRRSARKPRFPFVSLCRAQAIFAGCSREESAVPWAAFKMSLSQSNGRFRPG